MDQFLIETTHREQDCSDIVELLNAQGHLTRFDWGCRSGVHTGWAVIAADSETEARLVIPSLVRGQIRVVKVSKFDSAALAQMHKKESASPNPAMLGMFKAFPCWW